MVKLIAQVEPDDYFEDMFRKNLFKAMRTDPNRIIKTLSDARVDLNRFRTARIPTSQEIMVKLSAKLLDYLAEIINQF